MYNKRKQLHYSQSLMEDLIFVFAPRSGPRLRAISVVRMLAFLLFLLATMLLKVIYNTI